MKKSEKIHIQRVVELGCCVCSILGYGYTPCEVHHIRAGQGMAQRASNFEIIGLCPPHHRTGGHGVAIHEGRTTWEKNFGTERELLEQVNKDLGLCV